MAEIVCREAQSIEGNPVQFTVHGGSFLRKNREENPLLLQRQSHFPSENREDYIWITKIPALISRQDTSQ